MPPIAVTLLLAAAGAASRPCAGALPVMAVADIGR